MALVTVENTVTDGSGNPLAGAAVRIALVTSAANAPGYTGSSSILSTETVYTDSAGHWSAALTPNSAITPANTYYRVTEAAYWTSPIVVPASGGPYSLASILATPPPTPSAPGITGVQVAADGTVAGSRPEVNLIGGTGVTVAGVDNPGATRVDVTVDVATGTTSTTVAAGNDARINGSGPLTGLTRDTSGRITAYVENGIAWTGITYDASGRVSSYTVAGVTRTVTYNAAGQVTGVN